LAQNPTAKEVFAFTTRGNGNRLTEGPIWDPSTQSLFFAEPLDNVIWNWRPGGTAQAVRRNSHFADGLDLTRDGKLVAAEGEQYGASYYALPGVVYERSVPIPAARRSRANDIVARYDGTLYITGTDSNTVYSVRAGATVATLEAEVPRPNGIALSPDETLLYVVSDTGNSSALYRFRLQADGAVNRSQMLPPFQIGAEPDGVTVDREGNLYIALRSANGQSVEVRAPNGSRWGVITLPNAAFNVAFGGPRWTTLYVTAFAEKPDPIGALFEIELPVEGCPQ
jgi:gluconolactonase